MRDTTTLAEIFAKLNYFKDIEIQSDSVKAIAIDDAINELKRGNRLPWTMTKSTLKLFKDIKFYATNDDHSGLVTLNNENVDDYSAAATYFNTSLDQFIENVKMQRNLLTQTYINGEKALGVKNIDKEIFNVIPDTASDADNYEAVLGATKVGVNNVYKVGDYSSISFNITSSSSELKNTYEETITDDDYLEKYYIRAIRLTSVPTSIELRLQTDDTNYLSKVLTEQVTGLPFVADDINYIGFPLEEADTTGTFDSDNIASSKILTVGYTGMMYVSYDSINEFLLQQYWYYSKYPIISSASTLPDMEQFFDYENNDFDIGDKLIGPTEWIGPIIKKARENLLLGSENEYLRNNVAKKSEKATEQFDRKFPNEEPKTTIVRRRFNNNPEQMNYVP